MGSLHNAISLHLEWDSHSLQSCKPFPTWSCLPRHLLSQPSPAQTLQPGWPPSLSLGDQALSLPRQMHMLFPLLGLLILRPLVQVWPLPTNLSWRRITGFPLSTSWCITLSFKEVQICTYLVFIGFTHLSSAQPPFSTPFSLSTHKLKQSPLR